MLAGLTPAFLHNAFSFWNASALLLTWHSLTLLQAGITLLKTGDFPQGRANQSLLSHTLYKLLL